MTVPPLTNTAVSALPGSQAGIASGVNDLAARVAALLGVALGGLVFAAVFAVWLDMSHVKLGRDAMAVIELARNRPTSALEMALPARLRGELLSLLQNATITAYRAVMAVGVAIAVAGAMVAFLGITDSGPARSGDAD